MALAVTETIGELLGANPFFRRELRQLARRPGAFFLGQLAVAGGLGVLLLLSLVLTSQPGRSPTSAVGWVLLVPHAALCAAAGFYATDRIFGEEHRRGTLEGTLLLPLAPALWLLLRLYAPAFGVGLMWIAGWPLYLTAVSAGLLPFTFLPDHWWQPPAVGLSVVPLVLLFPPDYRERFRRVRVATGGRRADTELLLGTGIVTGTVFFFLMTLLRGSAYAGALRLTWFTWRVPPALLAALLGAGLLLAAGASVAAVLSGDDRWTQRSFRFRLALATLVYYLDVGLLLGSGWSTAPFWLRWGPILLFPLLAVWLIRLRSRPREDPLARAEVGWAERNGGGSVLLRDLRSYTRFTSVRRAVLREIGLLVVSEAVLAYLIVVRAGGRWYDLEVATTVLASLTAIAVIVGEMSLRPFTNWTRERTGETLPLLFLTPLASRTILRDRLLGGILYAASVHLPLLATAAVGFGWAVSDHWIAGAYLLAFCPILALFVVVLGCTVQPLNAPPWQWSGDDWLEIGLSILQVVFLFGEATALPRWQEQPEASVWLTAFLFFLLNGSVVVACYFLRVRQFEALRLGERKLREK